MLFLICFRIAWPYLLFLSQQPFFGDSLFLSAIQKFEEFKSEKRFFFSHWKKKDDVIVNFSFLFCRFFQSNEPPLFSFCGIWVRERERREKRERRERRESEVRERRERERETKEVSTPYYCVFKKQKGEMEDGKGGWRFDDDDLSSGSPHMTNVRKNSWFFIFFLFSIPFFFSFCDGLSLTPLRTVQTPSNSTNSKSTNSSTKSFFCDFQCFKWLSFPWIACSLQHSNQTTKTKIRSNFFNFKFHSKFWAPWCSGCWYARDEFY